MMVPVARSEVFFSNNAPFAVPFPAEVICPRIVIGSEKDEMQRPSMQPGERRESEQN